jgi:hypothetical protein
MISPTDLNANVLPLYTGQKRHLFQGQFRVALIKREQASLGGLIGPNSKVRFSFCDIE